MALNPTPIGDQIAEYLFNNRPEGVNGLPQMKITWEHIMTLIYTDLKNSIEVLPDSFSVTVPQFNQPTPVTGEGKIL